MKKICEILDKSEDETFNYIVKSLKQKITQWDYFVDWDKVVKKVGLIERELNLLNTLVGKENIFEEAKSLILAYPQVIKAIPALIAIREESVKILIDKENFIYKNFNFSIKEPSDEDAEDIAQFIMKSGLGELLKNKNIKSVVDYITGVEVGLGSNGRKNRGGALMESIVETFIKTACNETNTTYISQATAEKIKHKWNKTIITDKSSRIIDFAINKNDNLYFIETNFYGGCGSKLKSTAQEYIKMNEYWNKQGITFIWITDGGGWNLTTKPLREYFDRADFLLNLNLVQKGGIQKIINSS